MKQCLKLAAAMFMFVCCCSFLSADVDLTPFFKAGSAVEAMPGSFFYPPAEAESNKITVANIKREFRYRSRFFRDPNYYSHFIRCYTMQKNIENAVRDFSEEHPDQILKSFDQSLLEAENTPLASYLPDKTSMPTEHCRYESVGDLSAGGAIYCAYHGIYRTSELRKKYQERFKAARPWVTPFEAADFLIILPSLLILPISWFILNKVLEKKKN